MTTIAETIDEPKILHEEMDGVKIYEEIVLNGIFLRMGVKDAEIPEGVLALESVQKKLQRVGLLSRVTVEMAFQTEEDERDKIATVFFRPRKDN